MIAYVARGARAILSDHESGEVLAGRGAETYEDVQAPDLRQAVLEVAACIDRLRPLAAQSNTQPKYLRYYIRCEGTQGVHLFDANRPDESIAQFQEIMKQAPDILLRDSQDTELLYILLNSLGSATVAQSRMGRLDSAEQSSQQALEVGRRLIAHDPNNAQWLDQFAEALAGAIELKMKREAWPAAQAYADEALRLAQRGYDLNPAGTRWRGLLMGLRLHRATLAIELHNDYSKALAEIGAGLALVMTAETESDAQLLTASLRMSEWRYTIDLDPVRAAKARAAAMAQLAKLNQSKGLVALLVKEEMQAAYLDGDVVNGDRLYAEIRDAGGSDAPGATEPRHSVCARLARKKIAQCGKIEEWKPPAQAAADAH